MWLTQPQLKPSLLSEEGNSSKVLDARGWQKKALQSSMPCVWIVGSRDVFYINRPKSFVHIFFAISHEAKTQGQSSYQRRTGREKIDAWPVSLEHKAKTWPTPPDCQCPSILVKSPRNIFFKAEVYNAWDEDIAVVNVFFGKETVMGEESFSPKGYLFPMDFQSLRGASEWALSTSSPPSEACLGSALVSASSPSSRLCTGLLPGSLGICSSERNSRCNIHV